VKLEDDVNIFDCKYCVTKLNIHMLYGWAFSLARMIFKLAHENFRRWIILNQSICSQTSILARKCDEEWCGDSEQGYVYLLASSSSLLVICSSVDLKHLSIYANSSPPEPHHLTFKTAY